MRLDCNPGSLRSARSSCLAIKLSPRKADTAAATLATAAVLLATASPLSMAVAQGTLPPVTVEAAKKKAKAEPAVKAKQTPAPAPAATAEKPKTTNPYADPSAPYKVDTSASGKLTEPLLNTPRTVTAVPKEVIEDKGARDLRELARSVPGVTIGSAEGGNAYGAFAIRGFKASNDIFVDNIRNPGNLIPDAFFMEQVEIYKGPSGGIAGRNTIGGAVNIISKQPNLNTDFTEVTTTVGTDNTFRTVLDTNKVISPNFAVRANLMYDQHDVAGRDVTDSERWGGLISATAKPSDNVKITLDYLRYRNDATPDWGVPVDNTKRPDSSDNVPITELGFPRDLWVGMRGLDFMHESADIVTGTLVVNLGNGMTLTSRARAGQSEVSYVATSMEGYPDVHHPNRDQKAETYVSQTELNVKFSTGSIFHNMVAGVEIGRESIDRNGYTVTNCFDTATPSKAVQDACSAVGITAQLRPFPGGLYNPLYTDQITGKVKVYDATIDTAAVYLTDTIRLSKEWSVNAGLRLDNFERNQVGPVPANNPVVNNPNASVQADLFSWNAGIVYKPTPISSFYAAYATSQSPVGSELDSTGAQYNGLAVGVANVPPQEATSIELGTKWQLFDRHLLATAAIFQTDVHHARTNAGPTDLNPDASVAFNGKYRVRGIELGAAGNITKDWSIYGGLVLLDTEVLRSADDSEVGRRLANIPLAQFSLLSRYQLTDKLAIAGSATYGGEIYGGHLAANDSLNHTVDWWRFDAFAEYKLTDKIDVKLSALNLTDELYYDAIYQAPNTSFAFVAPGRAGYLTVRVQY